MSSDYVLIPYYSLKPNAITLFEQIEGKRFVGNQDLGFENLKDNKNKFGELSAHSTKRLRKSIDYMLYLTKEKSLRGSEIITKSQEFTTEYQKGKSYGQAIKYKLTFITLTLPSVQVHSDNEIKSKCLNHFLTDLRRKWKSELYIWKAEKQENGNIHFHIIADKYIKWEEIRRSWNKIINKLGYVDNYSKRMNEYFKDGFRMSENQKDKRDRSSQVKAYEAGKISNWTNPNSTDIHALFRIKNVSAYIAKYLAKGVTKNDRISAMKQIYNSLEMMKMELEKLDRKIIFENEGSPKYQEIENRLSELNKSIDEKELELEEYQKQGVQGRIWGCSQKLSKCKNLIDMENWEDIPEIDKIMKIKTGEYKHRIGSREIITMTFDIDQTPTLKTYLANHLENFI